MDPVYNSTKFLKLCMIPCTNFPVPNPWINIKIFFQIRIYSMDTNLVHDFSQYKLCDIPELDVLDPFLS